MKKSIFSGLLKNDSMPLFYTRKGDDGRSRIGKKKIYKLNPFVVALGKLDELNSFIGIVKSHKVSPSLKKQLHQVQEDLFIIQANVSYAMLKEKRTPPFFSPEKTKNVEDIIDGIEKRLKPARKFVISGTTHTSAWLDYLRALSRSVERSVLSIAKDPEPSPAASYGAGKKGPSTRLRAGKPVLNPDILPYLNRLSSLFFALARWEARGRKEKHPKYK